MKSCRDMKKSSSIAKQAPIQILSVTIVLVLLLVLFIQKNQNFLSILKIEFTNEKQAIEIFSQIDDEQSIISPFTTRIPFSNFHTITDQTLTSIVHRLIDADIRNSALLEKLFSFFYSSRNDTTLVIQVICKSKTAERKLLTNLQAQKIQFSKMPVHISQRTIWITILILCIVVVTIITIRLRHIQKLLFLLLLPWFVFIILSLSISVALIVTLLEMQIVNLFNEKPRFFLNTNSVSTFKIIKLTVYCVLCMMVLAFSDWHLLIGFLICAVISSIIFMQWITKQRNKEHQIPVFVKIIPNISSWLLTNKILMLITVSSVITVSVFYTNTSSSLSLLKISTKDIEDHLTKQYLSVEGSLHNVQLKPKIKLLGETVSVDLINPLDVFHREYHKKVQNGVMIHSITSLKASEPFLNIPALIVFIILCCIDLLDVLFSAGKKIKKLIYFKSSYKTLPDGITITITDASI